MKQILLYESSKLAYIWLTLKCLMRGFKIISISPPGSPVSVLKHFPVVKNLINRQATEEEVNLDGHKDIEYKIHGETIALTEKFYNRYIYRKGFVEHYSKMLKTEKAEAYFKNEIAKEIFTILRHLHAIRLSGTSRYGIVAAVTPINKFIIDYVEAEYAAEYKIRWVAPVPTFFLICEYYMQLFMDIARRGFVFNRARHMYKISEEASWGFHWRTLRNGMAVDDKRFRIEDVLLLQLYRKGGAYRLNIFREAKDKGFSVASVPKLKININKDFFCLACFYIAAPFLIYMRLMVAGRGYMLRHILSFHKECFPIEMLMNLYKIECYMSVVDHGDIATTIVLNKYGTRNAIVQWNDMTFYKKYDRVFLAHNIYFLWGSISSEYHTGMRFVDKKVNIGCLFKNGVNSAMREKTHILLRIPAAKKNFKTVVFFDTSFGYPSIFTEEFFIRYINMVIDFCERHNTVNVLLKAKSAEDKIVSRLHHSMRDYNKMCERLKERKNFTYLKPLEWSVDEAIAMADVCVTMGMTSPSTIALICGKEGLYFDATGNIYHPFAENHRGSLVFDDEELLFNRVDDILAGRVSCKTVVDKAEIRAYDAFDDDNALERLRSGLYEVIKKD